MTADTDVTPAEVRAWARATGRDVGPKGRISAELRGEYVRLVREAGAAPPAEPGLEDQDHDDPGTPPPPPPARGPQSDSAGPVPARQETRPRKVPHARGGLLGRARARVWGDAPKPRGPARARRPAARHARLSTARLIGGAWAGMARFAQPVNLPVSRCLAWQAPTAGALLEQATRDTFLDRALQPLARIEERASVAAAVIAPPVIVAALQLPQNQPVRAEVRTAEDGSVREVMVPWPAGAIRQQVLLTMLAEALALNAEAAAALPAEVRAEQEARERRRAEMQQVIDVFFAPPQSGGPAGTAAEDEAIRRAREHLRGDT